MSKIFFDVGMSLDGCIAGPNRGPGNPLGDGGTSIHEWMFQTASFLERIGLSGGETSPDDALVKDVFERTGAYVMGKRMFEEGEVGWPGEPAFPCIRICPHALGAGTIAEKGRNDIFFHHRRHCERAGQQAKAAAGGKDERVSGGAETIRQFITAGLINEFSLHVAPCCWARASG